MPVLAHWHRASPAAEEAVDYRRPDPTWLSDLISQHQQATRTPPTILNPTRYEAFSALKHFKFQEVLDSSHNKKLRVQ